MRRVRFGAVAALSAVVLASACTAAANGDDQQTAPDTLEYTGIVQQSGAGIEPTVVLDQPGGQPVRLAGTLLPELAQLAGGTVQVEGIWTGDRGGSLDVVRYELLNIAGGVPVVGVLEERSGTLWLRGADAVQLLAPPADLRDHIGARVWVIGETEAGGVRLQSYGVIAEP